MSCEELPASQAEPLVAEQPLVAGPRLGAEQQRQAEAMDEAYTPAGTQVTRAVRLVLVPQLDNLRSVLDNPGSAKDNQGSAVAADASVSLAVDCH